MPLSLGLLCPRAQRGAAAWAHSRPARELNTRATSMFIPLCMRSVCQRCSSTTFISQNKYVCKNFYWGHSICGSRRGCVHASYTGTETRASTRGSARGLLYGTRQLCIKERLTRDSSDGCREQLITKPLSGDAYKKKVSLESRHAVIPLSSYRNEGASILGDTFVDRAALATSLYHCSLTAVPQRSFASSIHPVAASSSAVLPPVGFIGLGNMGYPMAAALRRRGVTLCVYDPKQERKAQQLRMRGGVGIAKSLRDLASLLRQAEKQQKRQHQQETLQGQHKQHQHKKKQKGVSVTVSQQQQQQQKMLTVSSRESQVEIYEQMNEQGRPTTETTSKVTTSCSQRDTQQRLWARQVACSYEGATAISSDKATEGGEWKRVAEEAMPASEQIVAAIEEKENEEDEEAKESSQFSAMIICMLPEGQHVREVLLAKGGLFDALDVVDAEASAVAAIARSHTHQQRQRHAKQRQKQKQHLQLQQHRPQQQRQEEEEEEKHQRRQLQGKKHQQQYEENDEDEEQQQLHQSLKASPEDTYNEEVEEKQRSYGGFQGNNISSRKTLVIDCSTVGVRAAQEVRNRKIAK